MPSPTIRIVLFKLAVLALVVLLDATGHLSGAVASVCTVAVGSLGLTAVVAAWHSTPAPPNAAQSFVASLLGQLAPLIADTLSSQQRAAEALHAQATAATATTATTGNA